VEIDYVLSRIFAHCTKCLKFCREDDVFFMQVEDGNSKRQNGELSPEAFEVLGPKLFSNISCKRCEEQK